MESQRVKILSNEKITHDVLKIVTEKPSQYIFRPGQATDISIDKNNFINILSDEVANGYAHGIINADFLGKHINSTTACVYLCGPPPMMDAVEKQLAALHIAENVIIKEAF